MNSLPPSRGNSQKPCGCADCNPHDWFWPELLTERALDGDDDAQRCLAYAIDHALRLKQRGATP